MEREKERAKRHERRKQPYRRQARHMYLGSSFRPLDWPLSAHRAVCRINCHEGIRGVDRGGQGARGVFCGCARGPPSPPSRPIVALLQPRPVPQRPWLGLAAHPQPIPSAPRKPPLASMTLPRLEPASQPGAAPRRTSGASPTSTLLGPDPMLGSVRHFRPSKQLPVSGRPIRRAGAVHGPPSPNPASPARRATATRTRRRHACLG